MRYFAIVSIAFFACRAAQPIKKDQNYLREYSFCRCLYYSKEDSTLPDEISSSIYLDIGEYNFPAYEVADSLAKKFAANMKPSIIKDHEGKKAVIFECFKFYNSKQIDSLIRVAEKKIGRNHEVLDHN